MNTTIKTEKSSSRRAFNVAREARFGRAPRILPAQVKTSAQPAERTDAVKAFEQGFTRPAHIQRYKVIRNLLLEFSDVRERVCRDYATFSTSNGNQFAVIKPLSDGGLRIGVGDYEGIQDTPLVEAVGLGSSQRINKQFELPGYHVLSNQQADWLQSAYQAADQASS